MLFWCVCVCVEIIKVVIHAKQLQVNWRLCIPPKLLSDTHCLHTIGLAGGVWVGGLPELEHSQQYRFLVNCIGDLDPDYRCADREFEVWRWSWLSSHGLFGIWSGCKLIGACWLWFGFGVQRSGSMRFRVLGFEAARQLRGSSPEAFDEVSHQPPSVSDRSFASDAGAGLTEIPDLAPNSKACRFHFVFLVHISFFFRWSNFRVRCWFSAGIFAKTNVQAHIHSLPSFFSLTSMPAAFPGFHSWALPQSAEFWFKPSLVS